MDDNTYEQEIDLKDLMCAVLRKWRLIILIALAMGVVLGGYKMIGGLMQRNDAAYMTETEKQYQQDLEDYDQLNKNSEREIKNISENLEAQTEYLEKSILMKISPYDEWTASADVFVKVDDISLLDDKIYLPINNAGSIVKAYLSGAQVADTSALAKKMGTEVQYLKELITVTADYNSNMLSLSACYTDEEGANEILDLCLDSIQAQYAELNTKLGAHEIYVMNRVSGSTTDLKLDEKQKNVTNDINALQTALKEKEKAFAELEEPQEPMALSSSALMKIGIKYVVLGGVLGAFLTIFAICVAFLMTDKVASAKELNRRFGIKALGVFLSGNKRESTGIDGWLDRLSGSVDNLSEEERYGLAAANLKNYAGEAGHILVIGTVGEELLDKAAGKLGELCPELELETGVDLNKNAATVRMLADCEGVILVEQSGVSRYSEVAKEIEAVRNVDKSLIGSIVF